MEGFVDMEFGVVGISYKEMDVAHREQCAWTTAHRVEFQLLLQEHIGGNVLLSTCNRFEVYYLGSYEMGLQIKERIIHELKDSDSLLFKERLWLLTGKEAIEHLLKVTAGLESLVLGEDQILSQVKEAWQLATKLGVSNKALNKIFLESIRFSKEVRSQVGIAQMPISVAYYAYKHAIKFLENKDEKRVLIVGIGDTGQLLKTYFDDILLEKNIKLYRTSRSLCQLNEQSILEGNIHYEERYKYLSQVDCVISATRSPHFIFHYEEVLAALATRSKENELLFIDLAVPADIDRRIATIDGVKLIDIDEINGTIEDNFELRRKMAAEILLMIPNEADEILLWHERSIADPLIENLQNKVEIAYKDAMSLITKKIKLSHKEEVYIEKIIKAAVLRVVKEPILGLKNMESEELTSALALMKKLYEWE